MMRHPMVLTRRELNRALLERQSLLRRGDAPRATADFAGDAATRDVRFVE